MLIDLDDFEACFSAWAQSFAEAFDREYALPLKLNSSVRQLALGAVHFIKVGVYSLKRSFSDRGRKTKRLL
jgi:hypothetical protein